jgi:divalent metal cation (Fe/Co/Zn/Cd) transporter
MMLLNAIPRVILEPLVIWLGIEISSKITIAVVLVAVLIFFAVYNGIKDVNQLLVDRVRTLGRQRKSRRSTAPAQKKRINTKCHDQKNQTHGQRYRGSNVTPA